jgi:hypothetical protein
LPDNYENLTIRDLDILFDILAGIAKRGENSGEKVAAKSINQYQ